MFGMEKIVEKYGGWLLIGIFLDGVVCGIVPGMILSFIILN